MNKEEYSHVTYSEIRHYVEIAKSQPRDRAEFLQNVLRRRVIEAGGASDEMLGLIDSITERFVDEDRELRRQMIAEELRRGGVLQQEKIDADDDHIVEALKMTLKKFKSAFDWGGPYRVLVDCCDFPPVKTEFTKRFWKMGIYAVDNPKCVQGLPKYRPSIYQEEYCGHPFSYQAIQKGCPTEWGLFRTWKYREDNSRDFTDRKEIASLFRDNLIRATRL